MTKNCQTLGVSAPQGICKPKLDDEAQRHVEGKRD
ncbi:hypothetical protein SAMN05421772_10676 [Paracoccus saliphilus]|uniref:Uncharacterized protein n=1 Tax=Paracoccus saliphilus TaxID=405559 RepID=A0AA45W4D1_9RHOB|nr:hypothetical protein SAMN05421772_10676 [Paracoccus saliphilus]